MSTKNFGSLALVVVVLAAGGGYWFGQRGHEAAKVGDGSTAPEVKILTSCPSCLQGLQRYREDATIDADYIVVEMAKAILGTNWLEDYVKKANTGGIERGLL